MVALYTVPYVLFPRISAVAHSRSSAVNESPPSKWTNLPPPSPPVSLPEPAFPTVFVVASLAPFLGGELSFLSFLQKMKTQQNRRKKSRRMPATAMMSSLLLSFRVRRSDKGSGGDGAVSGDEADVQMAEPLNPQS